MRCVIIKWFYSYQDKFWDYYLYILLLFEEKYDEVVQPLLKYNFDFSTFLSVCGYAGGAYAEKNETAVVLHKSEGNRIRRADLTLRLSSRMENMLLNLSHTFCFWVLYFSCGQLKRSKYKSGKQRDSHRIQELKKSVCFF